MLQNTQHPLEEGWSSPLPAAAQGDAETSASASVPWRSALARRVVVARGASRHGRKWERSTARRRSGARADKLGGGGGIWVR